MLLTSISNRVKGVRRRDQPRIVIARIGSACRASTRGARGPRRGASAPGDLIGAGIDKVNQRKLFVLRRTPLNAEIDAALAGHAGAAKRRLGREVVTRYWGEGAASDAEAGFDRVFRDRETPEDMPEVELKYRLRIPEAMALRRLEGPPSGLTAAASEPAASPTAARANRQERDRIAQRRSGPAADVEKHEG